MWKRRKCLDRISILVTHRLRRIGRRRKAFDLEMALNDDRRGTNFAFRSLYDAAPGSE